MADDRDRLRRLRILQRLAQVAPNPMGEVALLDSLRGDPALEPTMELVRQSLQYLSVAAPEPTPLVTLLTVPGVDWLAGAITEDGLAWLSADSPLGLDIYCPGELPEPAGDQRRGRVSSVSVMPPEAKAWLDQELVRRNFAGYTELESLLASRGYEISRSALGRYGKARKQELRDLRQSIEMAKAFAEVVGDDGPAMNQTLTALAQQELMTVVRERTYDDNIKLPDLVRGIAQLNRSDINTRKFQIEQAARSRALEDAAEAVGKAAEQRGLNQEQADFWREKVLGVR